MFSIQDINFTARISRGSKKLLSDMLKFRHIDYYGYKFRLIYYGEVIFGYIVPKDTGNFPQITFYDTKPRENWKSIASLQ